MQVAMTRMSQNGQVVIPLEIRKDAKLKPRTKFVIVNEGQRIILKAVDEAALHRSLVERVRRSERQIKEGKFVRADTSMSNDEIIALLSA